MKKVLVAMDNQDLVEKLKKTGKYLLHDNAINYQEGVLQFLSKNPAQVIITKDSIDGKMTREIYIKQLRLIAPESKIIVFTHALDETYKGFLFANEIFNIIESDEINFIEVLDMIEKTNSQVIYKNKEIEPSSPLKVITKKLIAVYGTSGAGKSYLASVLSNVISKKVKLSTLLIDMDTQGSSLDIYNSVNTYEGSIMQVMEDIDNDCFDSNTLHDSIVKAKKNTKLCYLINNAGLYETQNKLSIEYYSRIYNESTSRFDVTVVDLPTSPFIDVVPYTLTRANDIFFVLNPNFIGIRQALKQLELMVNIWGIPKNNIHIVVNKKKKASLDKSQIETLLRGYKVKFELDESDTVEQIINGAKEIELSDISDTSEILRIFDAESSKKNAKSKLEKTNIYSKFNQFLGVNK